MHHDLLMSPIIISSSVAVLILSVAQAGFVFPVLAAIAGAGLALGIQLLRAGR
jgi:hypothetical protein